MNKDFILQQRIDGIRILAENLILESVNKGENSHHFKKAIKDQLAGIEALIEEFE